MKFRHLALKNVKGNWHQYIAFFLSCTFSVMIFYIFASFIYHPDIVNGHIEGGQKVSGGLLSCEYIIIIFSFFFVLYSESAFIKSRKKEFGLLALFGMTDGQIRKLILYENMLIATLSIASGLILGTIFSKLFLMAMSLLLNVTSPIRFLIVPKAVWITIIGFFAVFLLITLFQLIRINQSEIIDLLKASRKPKSLPVFSKWLTVLAIATLGGGYGLAAVSNVGIFLLAMFVVLGLVLIGTYFLLTQGSVALFIFIQKRPSIYYKRTNLITFSQLIFKMKDNARVLFMVATLGAVVMTSSGFIYIFSKSTLNQITSLFPETFMIFEKGLHTHRVIEPNRLNKILIQSGSKVNEQLQLTAVPGEFKLFDNKPIPLWVISNDMYNKTASKIKHGDGTLHVKNGQALLLTGATIITFKNGDKRTLTINGKSKTFRINWKTSGNIVNPNTKMYMIVLSNDQYKRMTAGLPDSQKWVFYGYELKNWMSTEPAIKAIQSQIPKNQQSHFSQRVSPYLAQKQSTSLIMFIGIFVSLLFFIASGSMIYFKLFTELQEDQIQFKALRRIGMTEGEIKKIVTGQIGWIFFIPFIIGTVHTLFAFKMLENLQLFKNVWGYGAVVIGSFFLMQLVYFFITRYSYMRRIVN